MTKNIPRLNILVGKKVLIMGDIGVGKTATMIGLLRQALSLGLSDKMTIIDFAPSSQMFKGLIIGGQLREFLEIPNNVRYLTPKSVETPRCSATNAGELIRLAKVNAQNMILTINAYLGNPTPMVFINDVSLLFQAGDLEPVLNVMRSCKTAIINGYYGEALGEDLGTGVSERERKLMEKLAEAVDLVIRIKAVHSNPENVKGVRRLHKEKFFQSTWGP